jgi:hypothetical protein
MAVYYGMSGRGSKGEIADAVGSKNMEHEGHEGSEAHEGISLTNWSVPGRRS